MKLCVVSSKECWRTEGGDWFTTGGFPAQIGAIASLFDSLRLVVLEVRPKTGGNRLPAEAEIVPLRKPSGRNFTRKLSVVRHLFYYLFRLRRLLSDADVVHVPLPGDLSLLGLGVALWLRKPVIGRYGGSWANNPSTTLMDRFVKGSMRLVAGKRNVMLATGEGAAPPARGMHWVYATSYTEQEADRLKPDLTRGLSSPPRLVFVGRLSSEKGVDNLIRALAQLKNEQCRPLPEAVIVGDGQMRGEIQTLAQCLGCLEMVTFKGQLSGPELSRLLLECDFCVQPSLTEGYSKAWLEAMLHGLPVISSDVGAARTTIGDQFERGWLVQPGNPIRLAETIRAVIQPGLDWAELRRRCRDFAENRTLDKWAHTIGTICAAQWGKQLQARKLLLTSSPTPGGS